MQATPSGKAQNFWESGPMTSKPGTLAGISTSRHRRNMHNTSCGRPDVVDGSYQRAAGRCLPAVARPSGRVSDPVRVIWRSAIYQGLVDFRECVEISRPCDHHHAGAVFGVNVVRDGVAITSRLAPVKDDSTL